MRRLAAIATTAALLLPFTAVPAAADGRFVDDDGSIHEDNIEAIAAEDITRGCNPPENDEFCPEDPVSRDEMAAFLVRARGLAAADRDYFIDDGDSIFEGDINRLAAADITRGCNPPDNDQYCPRDDVSRGEMAAFLVRAFGYDRDSTDYFNDDDESIFEADIQALRGARVTKGCNPPENDEFCPNRPVTRAEMASFLARALELDPPSASGTFTFWVLNVGQGDATVFEGPCGERAVLDVNRFKDDDVLAFLDSEFGSRDLAWMVVTHYDADHLGGVEDVGRASGVSTVYDRGGSRTVKDSQTYRDYYDWVTDGRRQPVDIGDRWMLCSGNRAVTFTVLSAGTDGTAANGVSVSEENDRGLCLLVEFAGFDHATCGDINGTDDGSRTDVESAVADEIGDVELAKINHHGSAFSSNSTYVNTLSAEVAIVSVGDNGFGHPSQTVLDRWDAKGDVYQTADGEDGSPVDGTIEVTFSAGSTSYSVSSEQGRGGTYSLD